MNFTDLMDVYVDSRIASALAEFEAPNYSVELARSTVVTCFNGLANLKEGHMNDNTFMDYEQAALQGSIVLLFEDDQETPTYRMYRVTSDAANHDVATDTPGVYLIEMDRRFIE